MTPAEIVAVLLQIAIVALAVRPRGAPPPKGDRLR